jgi:NADH-quinone oxidoreductase subunit L
MRPIKCGDDMRVLLALVPTVPLLGFALLFLSAGRLHHRAIALMGVGSVGVAAVLALALMAGFLASPQPADVTLWTWMAIDGFSPRVSLHLDALSLVMTLIITVVGFVIHVYSAEFMAGDDGYCRFFAAMNLFVAAMLVLVLAGDLVLLYLGWEGVGLCSYLLIGFWYRDPANGLAARKAFVVTRIGDTAMTIGLLVLFTHLGTTDLQSLMRRAASDWPAGSPLPILAAALLLGGAVGKSAQLPLQIWLPDAMAGPSPVSALIHAATMVTAGIYLVARTHVLYALAPPVQDAVAVIGAATLLLAGFSALNQTDLKRILAYSTISQIGYMVLALGVGAWPAAIFHVMTHAFFKALLFLAAGTLIQRLGDEHDIFRMGGLWRRLPLVFWTFLIGAASLAALPWVTAGFYSKDLILGQVWSVGGRGLSAAGIFGSFLTALYIFRAVFVVFFGAVGTPPHGRQGIPVTIALVVLSVLALAGGIIDVPGFLGGPKAEGGTGAAMTASVLALLGVLVAYVAFLRRVGFVAAVPTTPVMAALCRWGAAGWGFDRLYDRLLVRPFARLAQAGRDDVVDGAFEGLATLSRGAHRLLSRSQTGRVRWYAAAFTLGTVVLIAISVLP